MSLFSSEQDYWEEIYYACSDAGSFGDARRCPAHPHVKISSDDGMFDGVCHICEGQMEDHRMMWEYDQSNPRRQFCGIEVYVAMPRYSSLVACTPSEEDNIPF
jgi:hypothetical protein